MPSHGKMMRINDTVYNITRLNYNNNYIITVYAINNAGHGEPSTVTVRTPPGSYVLNKLLKHSLPIKELAICACFITLILYNCP